MICVLCRVYNKRYEPECASDLEDYKLIRGLIPECASDLEDYKLIRGLVALAPKVQLLVPQNGESAHGKVDLQVYGKVMIFNLQSFAEDSTGLQNVSK